LIINLYKDKYHLRVVNYPPVSSKDTVVMVMGLDLQGSGAIS